jgi:hypothetical protein
MAQTPAAQPMSEVIPALDACVMKDGATVTTIEGLAKDGAQGRLGVKLA